MLARMTRNTLIGLAAAFSLTTGAMAQDAPALWRVADADTTIYLFGTVHALPSDVDWYSGPVKTALDESSTLVTEIDMSPEALAEIGPMIQQIAILPEGTSLRGMMSEEQRETYEAAMASLGVPPEAFDNLEPWFAALQLSNIAFAKAGFQPQNGTETVLEATVGDTKGRDALETPRYQFSIFDELPMDAQIDYLVETAAEIDTLGPMLDEMIAEWAEGDVEALGHLLNDALQSDPVLAERLLYARNANWAVWIDDRLDTPGTIFMAVGAGHLAGTNKLQDLLAERGIQAVRVQ
ncbi:TraB/GumN family protein [Citromicrobium bathyomarinum]|uniref:TraB/GumN family protein n=1 Tax=Citromicrobium bathyomarinum TaxID=72174 RepID=UPI001E396630|nr:TraB/GumN family protein [Citromicrobium bathyomarinum]